MDGQIEEDPDGEEYYKEEYKNIFELKGDYERELSDLYYGATIYGWEEVILSNEDVVSLMIENGLAKQL